MGSGGRFEGKKLGSLEYDGKLVPVEDSENYIACETSYSRLHMAACINSPCRRREWQRSRPLFRHCMNSRSTIRNTEMLASLATDRRAHARTRKRKE